HVRLAEEELGECLGMRSGLRSIVGKDIVDGLPHRGRQLQIGERIEYRPYEAKVGGIGDVHLGRPPIETKSDPAPASDGFPNQPRLSDAARAPQKDDPSRGEKRTDPLELRLPSNEAG